MTENNNENIDSQNENNDESCSSSSCCSGSDHGPANNKLKFIGFAVIMMLAAAVAGNAINQKHKNGGIDTCGTNACTPCPSQLGTTGSCPDGGDDCSLSTKTVAASAGCPSSSDGCSSAAAGCPSQDASACSKDSAGCTVDETACGSTGCTDKK